ncbi:MAG: hypothetical protein KC444_09225 [Nitrosopumilus sp.]|nr:hypothetical protein [Nitrosopumilus sp.]
MPTLRIFRDIFNAGFFRGKKSNAIHVGRSEQFAGSGTKDVPFSEFYQKYHQWPQAQRAINSVHRRLVGSGIKIVTEDDVFTDIISTWMEITNARQKIKQAIKDGLITGTLFLEKQYDGDLFANIEHIPTLTIYKLFRDRFGVLKQVTQLVDGESQNLDPDHIAYLALNNPEKEALGKSIIYSVVSSRHVAPEYDENGNAINYERYVPSILDMQARIQAVELENAENLAKARVFVKIDEPDRQRQEDIEKDISNTRSKKWLYVTNKDVDVKEVQISQQNKLIEPVKNMNNQIDLATGYPSSIMLEGGSMGYASTQTPVKDFTETIQDMQNDFAEMFQDQILKPLIEQFSGVYHKVKPRLVFEPFIEELTFEEFLKIDPKRISDQEYRDYLRTRLAVLNDDEFATWKKDNEDKAAQMQDQKAITEKDDSRPDIEKDMPSVEYLLRNPNNLQSFIQSTVQKVVSSDSAPIHFTHTDDKITTEKPEVTDPDVIERLEEIKSLLNKKKRTKNAKQQ